MKKSVKAIAVLMVVALSVGGVSAASTKATEDTTTREKPAFSKRADAARGNFGFRFGAMWNSEANQGKKLTEEEKAAKVEAMKENRKKALDQQLAAGKITQEEYDAAIAKLEAGEFSFPGRGWGQKNGANGNGAFNGSGFRGEKGQRTELTEEEKAAKLATMKENWKKALDKRLADGKITQEQYDEAIAKLESGEFKFPGNGFRGQRNFDGKPFGGNRQGGNRWQGKWQGKGFAKWEEQPAAQVET